MPTSTLLRASFFALGAAVGGGAVAVLNASKKEAKGTQVSPPLVEVGVTGDPRLSARATTAVGPVLRYGNPGTTWPSLSLCRLLCVGPISDELVRQVYVAAYDRRLRHPAWVSWTLPCFPRPHWKSCIYLDCGTLNARVFGEISARACSSRWRHR